MINVGFDQEKVTLTIQFIVTVVICGCRVDVAVDGRHSATGLFEKTAVILMINLLGNCQGELIFLAVRFFLKNFRCRITV